MPSGAWHQSTHGPFGGVGGLPGGQAAWATVPGAQTLIPDVGLDEGLAPGVIVVPTTPITVSQ